MSRLVRWPGMPTSGRYVYACYDGEGWGWQCDLHEEDDDNDCFGFTDTWANAFAEAFQHAKTCYYRNDDDE